MKLTLLSLTFLLLASCGKKDESSQAPIDPTPTVTNSSIQNKFQSVDGNGLHGINELDYSQVQLGVPTADESCNGSFGNSGDVNGVAPGFSLMEGTSDEGTLQFGHLAYVNATPQAVKDACRAISKERYTYKITGDILTLCMVNYPFCADYKVIAE